MDGKRASDQNDGAIVAKKQKTGSEIVVAQENKSNQVTVQIGGIGHNIPVARTSNLLAPIMLLSGHQAEVYSVRFSPTGDRVVSGSFDKTILLWKTYGECDNYMQLRGHQNAVLEVTWYADERNLVSCGADKNVFLWDHETGQRIKKFAGHASCVNSCHTPNLSPHTRFPFVVTGSDDSTIKLWDNRVKGCIETIQNKYPVTSVSFSDSTSNNNNNNNKSSSATNNENATENIDNNQVNQSSGIVNPGQWIITSGVDEVIKVWDWRKLRSGSGNGNENGLTTLFQLEGHNDTITGIRISRDGAYLLSTGMDNNTFVWDIRPFVPGGKRLLKQFHGVQHNYEKLLLKCAWSSDDSKISSGSSDRFVNIWDTSSRKLLYKLPGHKGSVNDVDFHPSEPIIASCSSDQSIYLGEIKP